MIEKKPKENVAQDGGAEEDKCDCGDCILEEGMMAREISVKNSTEEQSLGVNNEIGPTQLNEMISNSIKEAVQTVAKHYSMVFKMQVSTMHFSLIQHVRPYSRERGQI